MTEIECLIYAALMHHGKPKTVAQFERAARTVADMLERRAASPATLEVVIGGVCGGVADGEEVIKQRLADALCAVVDGSGLKRKEVAQMLAVSEANLSIKLNGDSNLTIMSVANICGAVGANLTFRAEAARV